MKLLFDIVFICVLFNYINADTCEGGQVDVTAFTTQDGKILRKIAYIADFTLSCNNGVKDITLYAEVDNAIVNVARTVDGQRYQVSWVEDTATAVTGTRHIKLYDEQGYSSLRKAQRTGENVSSVKYLATIDLYHPGVYKGPWIQSETLAVIGSIAIFYYAFVQRSIIMA